MAAFLTTMEPCINPFGGRRFRVHGDQSRTTLALKDIITIIEQKCLQENRNVTLSTLAEIKLLDKKGNEALSQSNLFIRILTYIRQFFGNFRFDKKAHVYRLDYDLNRDGYGLRADDTQFLVEAFNREPHLALAATKLLEQLTSLANMTNRNPRVWNRFELRELATQLHRVCPTKLNAILELPYNGVIAPLKVALREGLRQEQEQRESQRPAPPPLQTQNVTIVENLELQNDETRESPHQARMAERERLEEIEVSSRIEIYEQSLYLSPISYRWHPHPLTGKMVHTSHEIGSHSLLTSGLHDDQNRFRRGIATRLCNYFEWNPISLAKLIHHYNRGNVNREFLIFIKEQKPEIYIEVLKNVLLNHYQDFPISPIGDPLVSELSDEEFCDLIDALEVFIKREMVDYETIPLDSLQMKRVKGALRALTDRLWLEGLATMNSENDPQTNRFELISCIINEFSTQYPLRPKFIAQIHTQALSDLGNYAERYFIEHREDKNAFISYIEAKRKLIWNHLKPLHVEDLVSQTIEEEGFGIFSYLYSLHGVDKTDPKKVERLLAMLPLAMFGMIVKQDWLPNYKETLFEALHVEQVLLWDQRRLGANWHWEKSYQHAPQIAQMKLVSLYEELDKIERLRYFPRHYLAHEIFEPILFT